MIVCLSHDLERKARATEFGEPSRKVANVLLVFCLNLAPPAIGHLKLPLNYQVGTFHLIWIGPFLVRLLGTEPEVIVVTIGRGGYSWCVKSHDGPLVL